VAPVWKVSSFASRQPFGKVIRPEYKTSCVSLEKGANEGLFSWMSIVPELVGVEYFLLLLQVVKKAIIKIINTETFMLLLLTSGAWRCGGIL
jgi:hypothetical protein